jgi:hypothetical protein
LDTLTGGTEADRFILGAGAANGYVGTSGTGSLTSGAFITDFNSAEFDTLQLATLGNTGTWSIASATATSWVISNTVGATVTDVYGVDFDETSPGSGSGSVTIGLYGAPGGKTIAQLDNMDNTKVQGLTNNLDSWSFV